MDPFEDFEMRPLTEGLGFHKKALKAKKEVKKTDLAREVLGETLPVIPPANLLSPKESTAVSKNTGPKIHENLPREGWQQQDSAKQNITFNSFEANNLDFYEPDGFKEPAITPTSKRDSNIDTPTAVLTPESFLESALASNLTRRGAADSPPVKLLLESPVAVTSLVVDSLLITAFSMIFLVCLLLVTKTNLDFVLAQVSSDLMLQLSFYSLVGFIGLTYFTISRVFCGQSLGEWAFEYQVGKDEDQNQKQYPVRVLARSAAVLFSGIIVLPILSLIMGRDILARLTGVQLYQRQ